MSAPSPDPAWIARYLNSILRIPQYGLVLPILMLQESLQADVEPRPWDRDFWPDFDCTCWRLTGPLVDDDTLPDHACPETRIANLAAWVRGSGEDVAAVLDAGLTLAPDWPVASGDLNRACEELALAVPRLWPLPLGQNRYLGLVLRQWVQQREPTARETLATILAKTPAWRQEVALLQGLQRQLVAQNPERDPAYYLALITDATLAFRLRRQGLPHTPATVRHLRAVVAGQHEPLPARGVEIVTRVMIAPQPLIGGVSRVPQPPLPYDDSFVTAAESTVSIAGEIETLTGPLLEEAQDVALRHRDWVRQFRDTPLLSLSAVRSAQPGRLQTRNMTVERRYDYLTEAIESADIDYLVKRHRQHADDGADALTKHLDSAYHRVLERRKQDQVPTEPPKGWRAAARQALQERIASRLSKR